MKDVSNIKKTKYQKEQLKVMKSMHKKELVKAGLNPKKVMNRPASS